MITSSDHGDYVCHDCGHRWKASRRDLWWPLRIKWGAPASSAWFVRHRWEVESDGIERRVYGQTFHFGRLKVCLGPRSLPAAKGPRP